MIEGDRRQIGKLRFFLASYGDKVEPPQRIAIRRLTASAILKGDSGDTPDNEAMNLLNEALKLALKHGIKFEQEWIREVLGK